MAEVFISHSKRDIALAHYVRDHLAVDGIDSFLAPISLEPGSRWPDQVLAELRNARWVFFLASKHACQSQWVLQEVGGAAALSKRIVPIVWDIAPEDLPGWTKFSQALDLRNCTPHDIGQRMRGLTHLVKSEAEEQAAWRFLALVLAGIVLLNLLSSDGPAKAQSH